MLKSSHVKVYSVFFDDEIRRFMERVPIDSEVQG